MSHETKVLVVNAGSTSLKLHVVEGAEARRVPLDPWLAEDLDAFLGLHREVEITAAAQPVLARLRREHDTAMEAVRRSRATEGEPLVGVVDEVSVPERP